MPSYAGCAAHAPGQLELCLRKLSANRLGAYHPSAIALCCLRHRKRYARTLWRFTVRVRDTAGQPVDEVLVHFHIPDAWAARAQVDPPTVATRQGKRRRRSGHGRLDRWWCRLRLKTARWTFPLRCWRHPRVFKGPSPTGAGKSWC